VRASEIVRHTSDPADRATYGRYLGHLKNELELWMDIDEPSKSLQSNLEKETKRAEEIVRTTRDPDERGVYVRYLGYLKEERDIWNAKPAVTSTRGINLIEPPEAKGTTETGTNLHQRSIPTKDILPASLGEGGEVKSNPLLPAGPRIVNVVAPDDLPEHFTFEARIDDEIFLALVPNGGVVKGQVFPSMMYDIDDDHCQHPPTRVRTFRDMSAPKNTWRDGVLDCLGDGLCHPMLLNSLCCPTVALSQIMARMQFNFFGYRAVTLNSRTSLRTLFFVKTFTLLAHFAYAYTLVRAPTVTVYFLSLIPLLLLDLGLIIHFFRMMIRTRRAVRDEYRIPPFCTRSEDVLCSIFCTCCTLSQMGRHTADYETYRPFCCSDTGLPNHVEMKLPSDSTSGFSIADAGAGGVPNISGMV